jgi:hypothetical protein
VAFIVWVEETAKVTGVAAIVRSAAGAEMPGAATATVRSRLIAWRLRVRTTVTLVRKRKAAR